MCSEWPQKESIPKWLSNQSMKPWKSLTKIDLRKKLPFSSMPLKVHVLSGTNQSRPVSVEETVSEFSQQPAVLLTDGNNENEDEESD